MAIMAIIGYKPFYAGYRLAAETATKEPLRRLLYG
jgi:hypothetical protein